MTTTPDLAGISYRFEVTDYTCPAGEDPVTRQYLRVTGADEDTAAQKVLDHYCDGQHFPYTAAQRKRVEVRFLGYNLHGIEVPGLDVLMSVEQYGDGWEWSVHEYGADDDLPALRRRTDSRGQGLWRWGGSPSPSWTQDLGHMQFSLAATTQAEAEAEIRRRFGLTARRIAYPESGR